MTVSANHIIPNRIIVAIGAALALLLTACTSAASSSTPTAVAETPEPAPESVAVAGPAPGVLYVTTANGDLQAITPATGATETLWSPAPGELLAFEVAPVRRSTGLQVLLSSPESQIDTSLHRLVGPALEPVAVDWFSSLTICLDSHSNADMSVGHQLQLSNGNNGSAFVATPFDSSGLLEASTTAALTRRSMTCPRYSGDRSVVATSAPAVADVPDTIAVFIDGSRGSHQVTIDNCNLSPTSFSPDDEWVLLSAVCYGAQWADSGLYALPLVNLGSELTLADMPRLGSGVFGRGTWHPGANWVASTRVDAIENQSANTDFRDQRASLTLIDLRTGSVIDQPIVGGSQPHSLVWMNEPVHLDN